MRPGLAAACLALAVLGPLPSTAAEAPSWQLDRASSRVDFTYVFEDRPQTGSFGEFDGEASFDPDRPEQTKVTFVVGTESIDLGSGILNAVATSAEWFDSANHPEAVYRLTRLEEIAHPVYLARGNATIRGRTRPISTEITLDIADERATATGEVVIRRRVFDIGYGPLSAMFDVSPEVTVSFHLEASAGR